MGACCSRSMPSCRKSDRRPRGLRIPRLAKWCAAGGFGRGCRAGQRCWSPPKARCCLRPLARTPAGMTHLIELAETLQCAVVDNGGRMNFPSRHHAQPDASRAPSIRPTWFSASRPTISGFGQSVYRSHRAHLAIDVRRGPRSSRSAPRSLPQIHISGLRALPGGRPRHRGRREASLPALDRSGGSVWSTTAANPLPGPRKSLRGQQLARRWSGCGRAPRAWDASPISVVRMCMEVYTRSRRGLGAGRPSTGNIGRACLWNFDKAHRLERRLWRAGIGLPLPPRSARHSQQAAWAADGLDRRRRRFQLRPGARLWTAPTTHPDALRVLNNRAISGIMYVEAMPAAAAAASPERIRPPR